MNDSEQTRQYLLEATELLFASLDYRSTLTKLTELAVPAFADWCAVEVHQHNEQMHRLTVVHTNLGGTTRSEQLNWSHPSSSGTPPGIVSVLRTGKPELYPQITDELLQSLAQDEKHLASLRKTNLHSMMLLPLTARGRTFGVLLLSTARTERRYTQTDLHLAQEFARRAAIAVDNARLHTEVTTQRKWFMVTLASIGDGVIVSDTDAKLRFINPVAETLTGWSKAEALGNPTAQVLQVVDERTGEKIRDPVRKVLQGEASLTSGSTLLIRRDGTGIPVDDRTAPMHDTNGELIGGVLAFRDISGRKRLEQRMEIQYTVTKILAEAKVLLDAKAALVKAICEAIDFDFGEFWNAETAEGQLQLRGAWAPHDHVPEGFRTVTTFARGESLVGSVWASSRARWLERLDQAENFRRKAAAKEAGVRTGFAFPVCHYGTVVGVMAFYSYQVRREDEALLRLMTALGNQIGDFVERKRAEQDLRMSEERYRSLVEATAAIVWTSSPRGEVATEQPGWSAFTGEDFERLKGWGWLDTVHPDDRRTTRHAWREALSEEQVYRVEQRLRRHDGVYRHMMVRAAPVLDESGDIREWVGVHTDITHLKEAEAQKVRYAKQLQGLTNAALTMNSMYSVHELLQNVTDKAREIIGAHQALASMTPGHNPAERIYAVSLSDKYTDRHLGTDSPDGSDIHQLVVQANQSFCMTQAELEAHPAWCNRKGRQPPMRGWLAAPLVDRQGGAVGLVELSDKYEGEFNASDEAILVQLAQMASAAMQNVRLISEVQQHAAELEQRVEERTTELAATNRELEAFSYSVSHDLRAPLRSIDGFSQALLEDYRDTLEPTAERYLERIRSSTQRMGMLIDDLLNLSRLSRSEMHFKQVDLAKIALAILNELHLREPERSTTFLVADNLRVEGDEHLLTILLENLLENAWKFTSKREHAQIEVGMEVEDNRAVYFVRDNGAGFDQQYANKLFGAFQRLHTAAEFEGTGIGLATVQRIIHRHGGRVWAQGKVDHGATFYFTLPNSGTRRFMTSKEEHA